MAAIQLFVRANINDVHHERGAIVEVDRTTGQELVNNGRAKWVAGEELDTPEGTTPRSRGRGGRKGVETR